ncbi:hypothetical protein MMC20_002604 [Loxospora ochrophaea]|nr:hypothetical protein [Loxospora ochrophaea]
MPPKPPLNPRNFPRPPLLERTPRRLQIKWNGTLIADTSDAYWVLETTHPPSKQDPESVSSDEQDIIATLHVQLLSVSSPLALRALLLYFLCEACINNGNVSVVNSHFSELRAQRVDLTIFPSLKLGWQPSYYLPPSSVTVPLTKSPHSSFCEWKGAATYWNISHPTSPSDVVHNRIWSYESPTKAFTPIKDYLSFYAGPWDCYVDDELVQPQPGDFYGGWMTSEIVGQVKGGPGTWGW